MGTQTPQIRNLISSPPIIYCCDSDSLINLRDARLLNKLRALTRRGVLKIPKGVYRELHRKTDRLARILERWKEKYDLVVELDYKSLQELPNLERDYGNSFTVGDKRYAGFWASASGKHAVDSQVVALAKTHDWVVISNDDSIHGSCMLEGVVCRRWEELGRILLGPQQLSFFETDYPT